MGYYNTYNIDENRNLDTIVITLKPNNDLHNIIKNEYISEKFKKHYPKYRIQIVEQWDRYSLRDQLELLARAKLLIRFDDSPLHHLIFARDNTTIFTFCTNQELKGLNRFFAKIKSLRSYYKEFCGQDNIDSTSMRINFNAMFVDILQNGLL